MTRVFKYVINAYGPTDLDLPIGARVLSFGVQGREAVIWASVDPEAPVEQRSFIVAYTGDPTPDGLFVGTATMEFGSSATGIGTFGYLVLHCFVED